jgi:hypothetical protein
VKRCLLPTILEAVLSNEIRRLPRVPVQNVLDIHWHSDTVSVLLGTGTGSFRTKTDFATSAGPYSVAVGDFNGDGIPDLAVAISGSNTVSVLLETTGPAGRF